MSENKNIPTRISRKVRFLIGLWRARFLGYLRRKKYRELEKIVLFIGYPRSGHTLVASLLDAHSEIALSIEWDALTNFRLGYRGKALFYAIEKHSEIFSRKLLNTWTGYSYQVPGTSQGKVSKIKVIGDKLAGRTSLILLEYPDLLDEFSNTLGKEVILIHVIRNPFDTIATMARRKSEKDPGTGEDPALSWFADRYLERAEVVRLIKDTGRYKVLDLYHEELIGEPEIVLRSLFEFVGLQTDDELIRKCAGIINDSPNKSRYQYTWPEELLDKIHNQLKKISFLSHYTYSE